jgi:hypothetical protein
MRREAGLAAAPGGPAEKALLRAVGRLLHVDDDERLDVYPRLLGADAPPDLASLAPRERRLLRMLISSLTTLGMSARFEDAVAEIWAHPQVRAELVELLELLRERVSYLDHPLGLPEIPLAVHSRYTRTEILAAFGVGEGARPRTWQTGVWWEQQVETDLFAFTLDKSVGGFSPTTRYRDYAISQT